MAQADVLSLAGSIGSLQVDHPQIDSSYGEAMQEIARQSIFNTLSIVSVTAGVTSTAFPTDAVMLLGMFHGERLLGRATVRELEAVDRAWRDARGMPIAYVTENLSDRTFRLYPLPDQATGALSFPNGSPFGIDLPDGSVIMLHSQLRTDLPRWMDLPAAMLLLAREFIRDSDHRDPVFSAACQEVAALFLAMVL